MSTVIVSTNGETLTFRNARMFHQSDGMSFLGGRSKLIVRMADKEGRWYDRAIYTHFSSAEQIEDEEVQEPEIQEPEDLSKLRGIPLLDAAISYIEDNPDEWDQNVYRCKTGMCVAGHIDTIAGGKWASDPDHYNGESLLADDEDDPDDVYPDNNLRIISASARGQRLLNIEWEDAHRLFRGDNTLEDIKKIRNELAEGMEEE